MMTPQEALQQFCPEQLVVSPEKQTAVAAVAPLSSDTEETETSSPEEEDEDDKAPSHFICPLTLQIMRDPVLSRYGQNYERCAILEWLTSSNGHGSCPLTRRPLELRGLVSNHNLRCQIRQWQQQRDDHDDDDDENTHTPMKDDEEPHSAYFLLDWNDQAEHTDEDPPLILEYRPGNAAAMAASVERQQPTNRRQRRRRGFLGRLRRAVGASH